MTIISPLLFVKDGPLDQVHTQALTASAAVELIEAGHVAVVGSTEEAMEVLRLLGASDAWRSIRSQ
jgi:hypothetical protein